MLQITQRRQEGTLIAVYTGELDHHAARAAIEQTEDLLVLFPCEKLVLDRRRSRCGCLRRPVCRR